MNEWVLVDPTHSAIYLYWLLLLSTKNFKITEWVERHCSREVRALITGAEGIGFKTLPGTGLLKRLSLFTSNKWVPAWFSSELGKVKAVRKKSGAPSQLHHYQEKVGSWTATSPTAIMGYGTTFTEWVSLFLKPQLHLCLLTCVACILDITALSLWSVYIVPNITLCWGGLYCVFCWWLWPPQTVHHINASARNKR